MNMKVSVATVDIYKENRNKPQVESLNKNAAFAALLLTGYI